MQNIDRVREFIKLKSRKKALALELRMIESDIERLEPQILEEFIDQGVSGMTVDGKPVFLKSQIRASPVRFGDEDADAAYQRTCEALKNAGWGELVSPRFNSNTLSSYVRELFNEGGSLPEGLKAVLKITEKHSVGVSGA